MSCLVALVIVLGVVGYGISQEARPRTDPKKPDAQAKPEAAKEKEAKPEADHLSETIHSITVGGAKLEYKATAGTLVMRTEDGKPVANLFFVAYTKTGVSDLSKRPVTFAFNGGPGSSSVWLHMGVLGPRRVVTDDTGKQVEPPYPIVDNEYTLLDQSDLVFIDPVTTGFSRPATGQDSKQFHGVEEDIHWVGEFIRLYTTRYERWNSPKFLAGESYGTTRAAALVAHMQDQLGMNFNGVVLISAVLNFQTISFGTGNDLPYVLYLPSYAASAYYHKRLPAELQADLHKTLDEVKKFAAGDYTLALMRGNKLGDAERRDIARKVARVTGLTEEYVLRSNLRIDIGRFIKELLRGQRETIGRFDSRFKGRDLDAAGERPEYDPSYAAVQGPYTGAFNSYVRGELKFQSDLPYEILTGRVQPWNFGNARNRFLDVSESLRRAMVKNPELRVLLASGYYDLATPFSASEYTFDHMGFEGTLWPRITMTYYEAGHMMYLNPPSLRQLTADLAKFVPSALRK
jgi:carboxypeptidase C (cathepsin A)